MPDIPRQPRQDPEKLQTPDKARAAQPAEPGPASAGEAPDDAPEDTTEDTYEPSTVQVNRGREQGLGVGQKDIDYQHDPTGATPAERWVNPEPGPRVRQPDPLPPDLDPPA